MNDREVLRYSKQMLVPGFGMEAQERLSDSNVLLVGAGGLGCPAALYLAAAGVGTLTIADFDSVELDNLNRQILYSEKDLDAKKAESAVEHLRRRNSDIKLVAMDKQMDDATLKEQAAQADVVIDATDNDRTRRAINRACLEARTPLIYGAAAHAQGQLAVFDFRRNEGPCYACLYPEPPEESAISCERDGIIGAVVGMIGVAQALEAVKLLSGYGHANIDTLMVLDGIETQWKKITLTADPECEVCGLTKRAKQKQA